MRQLRAGPPGVVKAVEAAVASSTPGDPLAIPAFLRRKPGDRPAPAPEAPGAKAARTDVAPETAARFRERPDYRPAKDLPGRAADYYSDKPTEWSYEIINRQLRRGEEVLSKRGQKVVADMKSAMRATTEDLELWRGRGAAKNYVVGETIQDKAFSSWSTSYRTAANFAGGHVGKAGGTVYRLRLPKGNRAVVENEAEQEVLLAPDTKFRVAEIVENADKGANPLYRGPSKVYILEVVEGGDGAG